MKKRSYSMIAVLFLAAAIAAMSGCEYDVAQPQWEQEYQAPPTPSITQIEPAQAATPGFNTITIRGENFAASPAANDVYFGKAPAEVVASTATSVTVRRPTIVTAACTVNVVPHTTLVSAKFGPYRIDPVLQQYGSFLEATLALSVVAVDQAENLYVVEAASRNIVKVTPDGQRTVIGVASRPPTDARFGPDGRLYLPGNNRRIDVVNVQSDPAVVTEWLQLPSGKTVRYGDFDANGNFYTGGTRSDLVVVKTDLTPVSSTVYAGAFEIQAIRVFNNYVYLVVRSLTAGQTPAVAIYRHSLDGSGNLGPQELVFNWDNTGEFATRTIRGIAFSPAGAIFVATDSANPLLIVDPASGQADSFYKGILPSNVKQLNWGNGNFVYMITGDTALSLPWTVYRVDMGTIGAASF